MYKEILTVRCIPYGFWQCTVFSVALNNRAGFSGAKYCSEG